MDISITYFSELYIILDEWINASHGCSSGVFEGYPTVLLLQGMYAVRIILPIQIGAVSIFAKI